MIDARRPGAHANLWGVPLPQPRSVAAATALALAAALGGLAACTGSGPARTTAADATTSSSAGGDGGAATDGTSTSSSGAGATTTVKGGAPTSSTIAYFTVPPPTSAPPPDGGGYEPGESVGRRFTDAVIDGKRSDAVPIATPEVIKQLEPWKPYSRSDGGAQVPNYRYNGNPRRGSFDATLAPTIFLHCNVDTGKVVSCAFGE